MNNNVKLSRRSCVNRYEPRVQRRRNGFINGGALSGAKRRKKLFAVPLHFYDVPPLLGARTHPSVLMNFDFNHDSNVEV